MTGERRKYYSPPTVCSPSLDREPPSPASLEDSMCRDRGHVMVGTLFRHLNYMDLHAINQLDMFLEDVSFPTDKMNLVLESLDAPLSPRIQNAIALLPEGDYLTREEVRRELIGLPEEHWKEESHHDDEEDIATDLSPEELSEEKIHNENITRE